MALPVPVGRQHWAVYLPPHGHQVILGTAGTSKTVMAIHRAADLARASNSNCGRTLLVTYNRSLVSYLRHLAKGCDVGLTVETYGKFARGYLASLGKMKYNAIADPEEREAFVRSAIRAVQQGYRPSPFFDRPVDFFLNVLDWIAGHGISELQGYLDADRIGRMQSLGPKTRLAMWKIRDQYLAQLTASGRTYDWSSLAPAVRHGLASDSRPRRYRHIVVDEAQDLPPDAIRSLVEAVQDGGSFTLFGDYAQQIYGHRMSWRSCGLQLKDKVHEFVDNYRNTAEIARLALAMADMTHFKDSTDLVEPKAPTVAGAKPTLVECDSRSEESEVVRQRAAELGKYSRVAVLARTRREARAATSGIANVTMLHDKLSRWDDDPGVFAGTYHSAKGLEFDVVILPYCGSGRLPDSDVVKAFGEDEADSRESRLLYVGVTRARTELLVTYSGTITKLLPDPISDVWQVV